MKKKFLSLMSVMAVSACTLHVPMIEAKTIRAVSGLGPSHVLALKSYPAMSEKLEELTDGKWKIRDTPSGLLSIAEMNQGLKKGVVDMGTLVLPYFAADYPESALVAELSVIGTDNRAISSAVTEYIVSCQECQAEFASNGQVYTGSDATVTYELLTTKPVRSVEDLNGLRIRTAGSVLTRFISELGAEAVQMSNTEVFEGLSSGLIDGTYSAVPDLKNGRLYDVVTHVTNLGQGVFNAVAYPNVTHKLWSKMDNQERHALVHAAQYAQAAGAFGWRDALVEATTEGKKLGIEFIDMDTSLQQKSEAFRQAHLANVAQTLTERGVVNAQAKVDRYLALLDKWNSLVKGVDTPEALAELRYREIWSNRDLTQYGN